MASKIGTCVVFDVVAVGAVLILCLEGGEDGKDGDVLVTVDDCNDCTECCCSQWN